MKKNTNAKVTKGNAKERGMTVYVDGRVASTLRKLAEQSGKSAKAVLVDLIVRRAKEAL